MRIFRIGPFELNVELLKLTARHTELSVGPKVVETLLALIEFSPRVATKEELIRRIWPEGFIGEPSLTQNIYVLRKLFRQHGCERAIDTEAGVGYRLAIPATAIVLNQNEVRHRGGRMWFAALVVATACLCVAIALVAFAQQRPGVRAAQTSQRLYSIGRYYWNLRSRDGVRKSLDFFRQAIDSDPTNARAYAAMADANVTMGDYCFGTRQPSVYFGRAEQYADEALMVDQNSPEAHASLGFIRLHQRRADEAVSELRRAIALNASYAPAHEWYGIALIQRGDIANGRPQLTVAARLDPLSVATIAWLGSVAYRDHRYHEAILYSKMALELSPARMDALALIGQSYAALGDITAAKASFERYASVASYYRAQAAAMLALAEAHASRIQDARLQFAYARRHADAVDDADLAAAAEAVGDARYGDEIRTRKSIAHETWSAIEDAHAGILQ